MTQAYKGAIIYFILFSILLVISAALLFEHKIGFSTQAILDYYLGNEEQFISAKSAGGILKIILPHIFVFGLFVMVILHFLVFTNHRNTTQIKNLIYLTFLVALIEIISPYVIIFGADIFAYIKLFSFIAFMTLILYISGLLLRSIWFD